MNSLPSVQKMNQFATSNLQAFQSYADIVLNASERLVTLNIDAVRTASSYLSTNVAPFNTDALREQIESRMGAEGKGLEQVAEYFRNVNQLFIQTQSEIAELNTRRMQEVSESVQSLLDAFAKSGPNGAAEMVSAMKTAMSSASAAYENFVKTTRDVAETNLAAASSALQPVVAAGKGSRKAA